MKNERLYLKTEYTDKFIYLFQPHLTNRINAIVNFVNKTNLCEGLCVDSDSETYESFCDLIFVDNMNTFKKKADAFRLKEGCKMFLKIYMHASNRMDSFSELAKKVGTNLDNGEEVKCLLGSIYEIVWTNTLCFYIDVIYQEYDNPSISNFHKKMKYLLH